MKTRLMFSLLAFICLSGCNEKESEELTGIKGEPIYFTMDGQRIKSVICQQPSTFVIKSDVPTYIAGFYVSPPADYIYNDVKVPYEYLADWCRIVQSDDYTYEFNVYSCFPGQDAVFVFQTSVNAGKHPTYFIVEFR